jgi:two-component system nitrate/nitrite response regulator NarL
MCRANIKEAPVTVAHARETLPSSTSEGETAHDPQARKGMAIVLIARQTLTRHCLSRSFQDALPELRVVAVANLAGLPDASRLLRSMDLMVFAIGDTSVRDAEVFGQITWLRQHMPGVPLVLLIDRDDMDDIVEAMAQGVRGLITTNMELSEIGAAIQCVAAGGTFVPAGILVRFAQDRQNGSKCGPSEDSKESFENLTPRELEVLALLREGKPNKVIARELDIRESTVKAFVRRIFGKLRVSNRTQLALLAIAQSGSAAPKASDRR